MARREWAEQQVRKYLDRRISKVSDVIQAEHARAVRIVKADIRRIRQLTKTYNDVERIIIEVVLDRVLDKLQKGRA